VDDVYQNEDAEYARFITYLDEFVVITEDNQKLNDPAFLLRMALGLLKLKDIPDRWETTVFHVGSGSLGDLIKAPSEVRAASLRYAETHDDWEAVRGTHETAVAALQAGLIDTSTPLDL
jgi:hypothetical protein